MLKKARCENNKITINFNNKEEELVDIKILSMGKKASNGYVLGDKENFIYITIPIESMVEMIDLIKELSNDLNNLIEKITILSLGVPSQGWATPPTLPQDTIEIKEKISELVGKLDELKENLQ